MSKTDAIGALALSGGKTVNATSQSTSADMAPQTRTAVPKSRLLQEKSVTVSQARKELFARSLNDTKTDSADAVGQTPQNMGNVFPAGDYRNVMA